MSLTSAFDSRLIYGQYSYVADFGLMFYNARWYDPALGRFAQADSIIPNAGDPLSFDRYSYVRDNPASFVDPTGHYREESEACYPPVYEPENPWVLPNWDFDNSGDVNSGREERVYQRWLYMISHPSQFFLAEVIAPLRIKVTYNRFGDDRDEDGLNGRRPGATRFHMGIDAGCDVGTAVYPLAYGVVVAVGWSNDYGNYIVIEHNVYGTLYYSIYAHLGTSQDDTGILANVGDIVDPTIRIGTTGQTKSGVVNGRNSDIATDPHLHFEVRTSAALDLTSSNPFFGFDFWGYANPEYLQYWLDLGVVFGYDDDYQSMTPYTQYP